ncbi:MAG TPA: sigma-70 family RNA polymerase sigma factor [Thermotogota bacterium]|nr:sigma-70 family RNA polymerase sigma factor [Thermotogota bacterium]HRW91624.1 sigma-70 family RNA polymerase sigma factor [Thermotogota bacterium]
MESAEKRKNAAVFRVFASEENFIRALKKKDLRAYELLYTEYAGIVGSIAKSYLNIDDIDDVIQEVFLRVYKSVRKFKGDAAFSTWLYRIAVNVCKDFLKRYKKRSETVTDFDEEETSLEEPRAESDVEGEVSRELQVEVLNRIMGHLSEDDRLFITLRDLDGLDYEEISRIVEKPLGTVKSRIHYARKRLKELLEASGYFRGEDSI